MEYLYINTAESNFEILYSNDVFVKCKELASFRDDQSKEAKQLAADKISLLIKDLPKLHAITGLLQCIGVIGLYWAGLSGNGLVKIMEQNNQELSEHCLYSYLVKGKEKDSMYVGNGGYKFYSALILPRLLRSDDQLVKIPDCMENLYNPQGIAMLAYMSTNSFYSENDYVTSYGKLHVANDKLDINLGSSIITPTKVLDLTLFETRKFIRTNKKNFEYLYQPLEIKRSFILPNMSIALANLFTIPTGRANFLTDTPQESIQTVEEYEEFMKSVIGHIKMQKRKIKEGCFESFCKVQNELYDMSERITGNYLATINNLDFVPIKPAFMKFVQYCVCVLDQSTFLEFLGGIASIINKNGIGHVIPDSMIKYDPNHSGLIKAHEFCKKNSNAITLIEYLESDDSIDRSYLIGRTKAELKKKRETFFGSQI